MVASTFEMTLKTNPALGATEIFVPAERLYLRGFRVEVGSGLVLAYDPEATTLRTVRGATIADRDVNQKRPAHVLHFFSP